MALQAISGFFDGLVVLSYKLQLLEITSFLGVQTEGGDYRRYSRLMDATPVWGSAASLLSGVLYLAAVAQILRRKRSAHLRRDALLYLVIALLGALRWLGNGSMESDRR
jgi:hypothetical protein